MSMYLAFLGVVIIQWILINNTRNIKNKKRFLILVCVELIIFTGLREHNIGADTQIYLDALNYYELLPHESVLVADLVYPFDFEIGYFFLTKLAAWLTLSETQFLFVISIFTYIPIFAFINRYSDNALISIMVYFAFGYFEYSLGIFRQMIALSIVLFGIKYIQEQKMVRYISIIIIAMLFHTTAIIMLPFYWISRIKIKNKLKYVFLIEVILGLFARRILLFIVQIFPKYIGFVNSRYDIQGGNYTMLLLLNIILIATYWVIVKNRENNDEIIKISLNAIVLAIFLQILGYSMGIFGRIVSYYSIYSILIIPYLINRYFPKNRRIANAIVTVSLLFIFYILTKNSVIVPYAFVT